MDQQKLGQLAANLMDILERDFNAGEIEDLVIIAKVHRPNDTPAIVNISTAGGRPADVLWMLEHTKKAVLQ
jgi:hypothetical protein